MTTCRNLFQSCNQLHYYLQLVALQRLQQKREDITKSIQERRSKYYAAIAEYSEECRLAIELLREAIDTSILRNFIEHEKNFPMEIMRELGKQLVEINNKFPDIGSVHLNTETLKKFEDLVLENNSPFQRNDLEHLRYCAEAIKLLKDCASECEKLVSDNTKSLMDHCMNIANENHGNRDSEIDSP